MRRFVAVIVLLMFHPLFLTSALHAQEKKPNVFLHPDKFYKKFFPHLKIKQVLADTSYIKIYPNYLTLAVHILAPKISARLEPISTKGIGNDAASELRTNINTIVGLSVSYRHITAGFATNALLPPIGDAPGYVSTRYRTATVKYKSPIYILGFKFMKVSGMTDVNALNRQDSTHQYSTRPDIIIKEYHFDGIYNFSWKNYSYLSTLDATQVQIKSRVGYMIKAGIYNHQLYCDSNLLSVRQRVYFQEFNTISKLIGYTIKLAPGIGANIVFKKQFYVALSAFSPFNLYVNRLYTGNDHLVRKETSIQWSIDSRVTIGYQSKRVYASLRYEIDARQAKLTYVSYGTIYQYIGLDVGYRFTAPRVVKKFYKKTMPPGM